MSSLVSRPVFWALIALLIFVLYKVPADVSDILRTAGHVIIVLVNGFGTFLGKL
jgi:hypothetical protein